MRNGIQFALFSTAVAFVLAEKSPAQSPGSRDPPLRPRSGEDARAPNAAQSGQQTGRAGLGWYLAGRLGFHGVADGSRTTLPASDHPMSLIFSEKTCTVWLGDTKVASLSYSLDPKQNPWTLDMKFGRVERWRVG